jgi:hypothetical protein
MSGFSEEVANAVTQPLWPSNIRLLCIVECAYLQECLVELDCLP